MMTYQNMQNVLAHKRDETEDHYYPKKIMPIAKEMMKHTKEGMYNKS
jgi:hypothetical protein